MREILFRGKELYGNKDWECGGILQGENNGIIDNSGRWFILKYPKYLSSVNLIEVIPETVGQYTGLIDRNGKKIFEGDIVQAHFRNNHSKQIFRVAFDDGMFLFDNSCVKVPKYDIYAMEVIGNIHDNPELLGGADNA